MAYIFEDIVKNKFKASAAKEKVKTAWRWFTGTVENIIKVRNTNQIFSMYKKNLQTRLDNESFGNMYMFVYEAKYKATLPYYDQFPIIFPIKFYDNGFLGLNMHYISPKLRAILMNTIYSLTKNETENDNVVGTKKKKTSAKKRKPTPQQVLEAFSQLKYFQPCVKRYITQKHVKSYFIKIPVDEWDFALFLNTERFVKGEKSKPINRNDVWRDSEDKINGI